MRRGPLGGARERALAYPVLVTGSRRRLCEDALELLGGNRTSSLETDRCSVGVRVDLDLLDDAQLAERVANELGAGCAARLLDDESDGHDC